GDDPDVKAMVELGTAQALQDAYGKKHPDQATGPRGVQATPDETQAWIASHREDLERYKKAISTPMHGQQGPKDEDIAGIFVVADKAKAEGLDRDPETAL